MDCTGHPDIQFAWFDRSACCHRGWEPQNEKKEGAHTPQLCLHHGQYWLPKLTSLWSYDCSVCVCIYIYIYIYMYILYRPHVEPFYIHADVIALSWLKVVPFGWCKHDSYEHQLKNQVSVTQIIMSWKNETLCILLFVLTIDHALTLWAVVCHIIVELIITVLSVLLTGDRGLVTFEASVNFVFLAGKVM